MIKVGADLILESKVGDFDGVLIVANQSSVSSDLTHLSQIMASLYGEKFKGIISPEHGFLGSAKEGQPVSNSLDPYTGRPVYSWYGERQVLEDGWFEGIDVIFYDVQDGGVRFHTYLSTLKAVLETASKKGISFFVLDRPDPIRGDIVEGNVNKTTSIVGAWNVPTRYGLTQGEFASLLNLEMGLHADLNVVKLVGWKRRMWYDETGLPWVPLSPNTPTLLTSTLYPGTCMFEGTKLSVGRGTTTPFELIGAPWLDASWLEQSVNSLKMPGVRARRAFFVPNFSKYAGQVCQGVQLHVLDRNAIRPTHVSIKMLALLVSHYGCDQVFGEEYKHFDRLAGDEELRRRICDGEDPQNIISSWDKELAKFEERAAKVKLYQ
ncbi:MAG: exo-beta-N-acetylmuramidase NamZ family protein [Thermoprotei archaeon]